MIAAESIAQQSVIQEYPSNESYLYGQFQEGQINGKLITPPRPKQRRKGSTKYQSDNCVAPRRIEPLIQKNENPFGEIRSVSAVPSALKERSLKKDILYYIRSSSQS